MDYPIKGYSLFGLGLLGYNKLYLLATAYMEVNDAVQICLRLRKRSCSKPMTWMPLTV